MKCSTTASGPNWLLVLLAISQSSKILGQDTNFMELSTTTAVSSSPPMILQSHTSNSTSASQTHTIRVGLLDHKIRPETTEAAIGDTIEFDFYPLNHSIVRAEYGFPCVPYEMTGSDKRGFFSGFNPVNEISDNPPNYSIRINDTEPILFYCSAPGSCIVYGMVGGINLNSSMSIDRQRTLAMDSTYMLQPGEPFPAESPLPSGNPASPTSLLPPANSSTGSAISKSSSDGLSKGVIVGIIIAIMCAILLGAILLFFWGRTKSIRKVECKNGAVRQVNTSPNQMVEYKNPGHHVQPHHVHHDSQAGFQFPTHPTAHPGSPSSGYGHQHQNSVGTVYFPTNYPMEYTSSPVAHATYHSVLPGNLSLYPAAHNPSLRSTPAPGHYKTLPHGQGQGQMQERLVEMEAIAAVTPATDVIELNRASKL